MLGLLQRFHRLHIQTALESESNETTIKYPHVEGHKKKDGHSCTNIHGIHSLSLDDVEKSVEQACEKAKETVTELGMSELLKNIKIGTSHQFVSYKVMKDLKMKRRMKLLKIQYKKTLLTQKKY